MVHHSWDLSGRGTMRVEDALLPRVIYHQVYALLLRVIYHQVYSYPGSYITKYTSILVYEDHPLDGRAQQILGRRCDRGFELYRNL